MWLTRRTEDITLGPPKTMFASSRATSRLADFADKPATPLTEGALEEADQVGRSRFFGGDKQANRKSMNNTAEPEGRHARVESWTTAREQRKALGADDEKMDALDRMGKAGKRDRGEQDGERRNGFGDRPEVRWGAKDERRQNGDRTGDRPPERTSERQGGWREREQERRNNRDWDRGGHHDNKAPEWMDDPAPKEEDDLGAMGMPKNQEDFEKWKQAQHARNRKEPEEEVVPVENVQVVQDVPPAKPTAALTLDNFVDMPFGGWGVNRPSDNTPDGMPVAAKTPGVKSSKTSRFMPMFKKDEPKEEQQAAEALFARAAKAAANGTSEDKEGFQRILQMLGGTGINEASTPIEPASPPPKLNTNGAKPKSRFTGFFDQTPKSPERLQSPQGVVPAGFRPIESEMPQQRGNGLAEEPASMFGAKLPERQMHEQHVRNSGPPQHSVMSPEPVMPAHNGDPRQQAGNGRANDLFIDQLRSRGAATPDNNIQNLLATQRNQRPSGPDKNSEFLLNLLQTKGSRPPSQPVARLDNNMPLWLDQPMNDPQHAPKSRAPPPPGLYEDQQQQQQLYRTRVPEPTRQDLRPLPGQERRDPQRAPPGFFNDQDLFLQHQHQHQQQQQLLQQQQQRRNNPNNFPEPPQPQHLPPPPSRRMSGHPGLMQQQQPPQQQAPYPPEFLQMQAPLSVAPPPPGFNPHMPRHPPGFHHPNIFQPPLPAGYRNGGPPPLTSPQQHGHAPPPPGFFGGPLPPQPPPGFMGMRGAPSMEGARAAGRGVEFEGGRH